MFAHGILATASACIQAVSGTAGNLILDVFHKHPGVYSGGQLDQGGKAGYLPYRSVSPVARLRELLLQVAMNNTLAIWDGIKVSAVPRFCDSSLNFELRCFIRLVDRRVDTLSDLNFAIERALRQAGIQVPFPQRDLHVRSVDPSIDLHRPKPEQ